MLAAGRAILAPDLSAKRIPEPVPAPATPARAHAPSAAATELALTIARFLDQRQTDDLVILDVSGPLVIADYFVVGTVQTARQATALAKELDATMKQRGQPRRNHDGMDGDEPTWVLRDYDDVVVHLFQTSARSFYDLESLWADVPRLPFTPAPRAAAAEPGRPTERRTGSAFRILPTEPPPDDAPPAR